METTPLNTNLPFTLPLTFEQIQLLVLQLPNIYKQILIESLLKEQSEVYYNPSLRGSLDISQYKKAENKDKNWDSIVGKWPGNESDVEILAALKKIS